jgi:TolB-like protein/Tfp pilus assembly protein PilF
MGARGLQNQPKIPREAILAHLDHILSSGIFSHSSRLRDILAFVVRETLDGRAGQIKEYVIAIEVYRKPPHEPARDSIVRTAVGRLRHTLDTYYENEAIADGVRIDIPRGGYIPTFRQRTGNECALVDVQSCAVLPFRDFRGDDPNSHLADDITDELIHTLTYVRALKVTSRTSCFAFRHVALDVTEIARRLGVSRIIEGSLRRVGSDYELTVGLINASDGRHIWSGKFSGPHGQILNVQRRMAQAIMFALRPVGNRDEIKCETASLSAWSLYRQGRLHSEKRTAQGWEKSIACYRQALKADNDYSLAHAGIADVHILLANFGEMQPALAMPMAREAAETALAIDPMSAEAHTSFAAIRMADWNWAGAEQEFQLALQLSPSYAQAHHWYARFLAQHLRVGEAAAEMEEALRLDPVSPGTHVAAGMLALEARDCDAAVTHFQDALNLVENHPFALWQMGLAHVEMGNAPSGVALLRRVLEAIPRSCKLWSCLGYAHAKAGNKNQAMQFLKRIQRESDRRYVSQLDIALVHIGLGHTDHVLTLMEQAIGERDNFLLWLSSSPFWAPLHCNARFCAIVDRVGLPRPR